MLGRVRTFGSQVGYAAGGYATAAGIACRRAKRKAADFFSMFRQAQAANATTTTVVLLSRRQLEHRRVIFGDIESNIPGLYSGGLTQSTKGELIALARKEEADKGGPAGWSDEERGYWADLADTLAATHMDTATSADGRSALNAVFWKVFDLKPEVRDDTSSS